MQTLKDVKQYLLVTKKNMFIKPDEPWDTPEPQPPHFDGGALAIAVFVTLLIALAVQIV